jgi:hypothetical protein
LPAGSAGLVQFTIEEPIPKFILLNRLIDQVDLAEFEYIIAADDDIRLPAAFLDRYLNLAAPQDLSLARPARTRDSFTDHVFVNQINGISGRLTRFVEIGPLFSFRGDLFEMFLPFDESSPMGWGYDLVWPLRIEKRNLKMGIIDASPVTHNLRKPVSHYALDRGLYDMKQYLAAHPTFLSMKPLPSWHLLSEVFLHE